jgi:DNA primase
LARIGEAELARIKAEVSLARLVEGVGVELRAQGQDLVGRCPFHDDAGPSLVVSPGKNLWHCLGACQTGGSVVDWVMRAQGVSFRHAVELLRTDAEALRVLAVASPLRDGSGAGRGPVRRSTAAKLEPLARLDADDAELLGQVVGFYHQTLLDTSQSGDAVAFLERRRLAHPEAVEAFKLGYANRTLGYRLPHARTVAGKELRGRLQRLGVLRVSGHEHFTGCLTVPLYQGDGPTGGQGQVGEVYGRKVRDDLRAGTAAHLVLPGPHSGVFNPAAFTSEELIVCEAIVDALSAWCAGFRHVTAAFGADGWTDQMTAAVQAGGVKRVLIGFDRDQAGDAGAKKLAAVLAGVGVECFRVELPAGADVNDVTVAAANPTQTLGRFLRSAAWMGTGPTLTPGRTARLAARAAAETPTPTPAPTSVPVSGAVSDPVSGLVSAAVSGVVSAVVSGSGVGPSPAAVLAAAGPKPDGDPERVLVQPVGPVEAGFASPVPSPPPGPACEVSERELVVVLGDRRWRVRGLDKVTSFDVLRVNVLVSRDTPAAGSPAGSLGAGGRFHVDTLDLYSARARLVFVAAAAAELGVEPEVVKSDLGRVLLAAEVRAEEVIAAATAPAVPEVTISPEGRAAALALLRDPGLVERIADAFAAVGVVGERDNCLVGYLAAVSRKLPAPLAVIVQSTSAAGKSALMEAVLGFVPAEDRVSFSAMTGQSLFYLGETDLAHKVLSIAEEEGASRASYALKLLQSEGELSIASTGKDTASGRLVTHTYRVQGPAAIVLTTTSVEVDEELLNRCLVLTVDEDRAQTRAIHAAQRRAQTLAGLTARAEREQVIGLHRDAQRLLEPLAVVNPYADALTFADTRTRTRRDHGKYLGLIAAVTLLHQYQRDRKTAVLAGRSVTYVESTLADIAVANRLAHAVLGQSLDELPPQTRRLLHLLHTFVTAEANRLGVEDLGVVRFTRRQIRETSGWGDTQLKVHLARLVDLELVHAHRSERGTFAYELAWRGEGADGASFLAGLVDPAALATITSNGTAGPVPARTYGPDRSGSEPGRSGSGRRLVGVWSGTGRTRPDGESAQVNGHFQATAAGSVPETTTSEAAESAVIPVDAGQAVLFTEPPGPAEPPGPGRPVKAITAVNGADLAGTALMPAGGR